MTKFVQEGVLVIKQEDGGMALIGEIHEENDSQMFVRVQSWADDKQHTDIAPFLGKRVRVTVEVMG